jgi:3D (Asp-Asp-Asp) domain-containing protein
MKLRSRSLIFVAIAMLVLFYLAESSSSSSLAFASSSTAPSVCSGGWYVTGYFNPREVDYPGHLVSVKVQGVGKVMLSDNFMKHQNIEGMGLTRFGWWLAGQNEKDYRKVPYPEDGMNPPGMLRVGYSIATDSKKIPLGTKVKIPTLPYPWGSYIYTASDTGVFASGRADIVGKHIDIFVGDGIPAQQIARNIIADNKNHQVCILP